MPGSLHLPICFRSFPESLSAQLFADAKPVKLAADEVLFLAGDPGDGCYRVEQGLLKVSMIAASGAERILAIVGPGAIVGELSTIDGLPRSASVAAVRDSELTFVSRAAFQAFADTSGGLQASGDAAGRAAARHRRRGGGRKLSAAQGPRGAGAARSLGGFGQDVGQGRILIRQKVSQSDVAAMAGIARENVSRILNDWIRDKLVSRLSGYYCLEDKSQARTRKRVVRLASIVFGERAPHIQPSRPGLTPGGRSVSSQDSCRLPGSRSAQ